jgi:selenocysteine-specific elongation factor
MIVGTAGHIDHGKTSLVRALTGVDTDRLPEEKKRGITIELGYAFLPPANADEETLGFIDVPGHEKFVQTMLAGATGIDFAILVVAADDGVMPQTREHLDILSLLDVCQGAVAITKCDRVDAERVAQVKGEIASLLAATSLANAPMFPVSSVTGEGVAALKSHLSQVQSSHQRAVAADLFRLAIDRVFTLDGIGTMVTGTIFSGQVRTGDHLVLTPSKSGDREIRVRSIHAQNRPTEIGVMGQRCALNLAGVGRDDIARGQWLTSVDAALATDRFDATVRLLPDEKAVLRGGASVHLHLGTEHTLARVVPLSPDTLAPGESAYVQLVLKRPIGAWHGDRLVLRDAAASRTIGGGRVVDPFAPSRYRRTAERLAALEALAQSEAAHSLHSLMANAAYGVDLPKFARSRAFSRALLSQSLDAIKTVSAGEFAFAEAQFSALENKVITTLDAHHKRHPEDAGPDPAQLKRIAFPRLPESALPALLYAMTTAGTIVRNGPWLARPVHAERLTEQDRLIAERALPLIADGRFDPPWVRDIAKSIAQPEAVVRGVLSRLARQGRISAIVKDLYYDAGVVTELSTIALKQTAGNATIRAAGFRDATGLGRKRAIQILEFFDRIGFTRRLGDEHAIRNAELFSVRGGVPVQPRNLAQLQS